jgi:hypothetical protein
LSTRTGADDEEYTEVGELLNEIKGLEDEGKRVKAGRKDDIRKKKEADKKKNADGCDLRIAALRRQKTGNFLCSKLCKSLLLLVMFIPLVMW